MNNVTRHKDTMTGEYQSEREADIKHILKEWMDLIFVKQSRFRVDTFVCQMR